MNSMKTRRTVRSYDERPLEQSLLDELLETACRASNTGNMQAYSIIVTRSASVKEALSPLHFNQPQVIQAPVVLTFCADFNRFTHWCEQRGALPGFNNIQAFTYAAIDAIITAQAFCTAAEEKGLGICYLGTTTYNAEGICRVLELPALVVPVTTVTVGYPREKASGPLSDRLPLEAVVHEEVYKDYTSTDIDKLYAPKEALPESQQCVAINQKENLAQVFADIRYKKADNEYFSTAWIQVLKEQGYLD
jgi:nitroreductase